METSVRKSVVHSRGSEQSVNTWYTFSWTCIPALPWKKGFAGFYNNFESMPYSGIQNLILDYMYLHYIA